MGWKYCYPLALLRQFRSNQGQSFYVESRLHPQTEFGLVYPGLYDCWSDCGSLG